MTTATQLGRADLPDLMTLMTGDEKHGPSATSTLDVLWVLYDRVLRIDPDRPDAPDRDRFLLSKGHGPMAYYAVLAAKGFLTTDDLRSFGRSDSILGYHPDRTLVPASRSPPGRWVTGSAWPSAPRSACGSPVAPPGSSSSSATRSWRRARTWRRSSTPDGWGWPT